MSTLTRFCVRCAVIGFVAAAVLACIAALLLENGGLLAV
jgi:hypothetical protein